MLLGKLKIIGHSMEPSIYNGSTVLISDIFFLFRGPKINDMVAFRIDNKIFVKRITMIKGDNFILKGDNLNDSFDSRKFGFVKSKNIIGKVFKVF